MHSSHCQEQSQQNLWCGIRAEIEKFEKDISSASAYGSINEEKMHLKWNLKTTLLIGERWKDCNQSKYTVHAKLLVNVKVQKLAALETGKQEVSVADSS